MARKSSSSLNWSSLGKLFYSTLPEPLAGVYLRHLRHWVHHKGPEWTTARMKALWNCALLLRAGQNEQIPSVCRSARIACADGIPKGIEGHLIQRWSKMESPSKLRQAAVALRAYTAIRLSEMSDAQLAKAKQAITSPGKEVTAVPTSRKVRAGIIRRKRLGEEPTATDASVLTLLPYRVKPKEGSLKLSKLQALSGTSAYPNFFQVPGKDKKERPYTSLMASLVTKGKVPSKLVEKLGDYTLRGVAESIQLESGDTTFGKVVMLQEGGAKARTICSPNAWVQFYAYPYHRYLMQYLMRLENSSPQAGKLQYGLSVVLDQTRGVYEALNLLNSGSYCHAVDLSSATDRFPLLLQKCTTMELGIPEFGEALEELRGPYAGPDGELWSYNAGQPMGLYGSFPLFHITHFALLNGLSHSLGLGEWDVNFVVLGDDVLIFDQQLAQTYLKTLESLDVPVSWHKSYKGNLVEFAGFLITKSRDRWTAFRPYKWGPNGSLNSVLNTLHSVGVSTRKWSTNWAKRFDLYQKTQGLRSLDLSPLIPDEETSRNGDGLPGVEWLDTVLERLLYFPSTVELPYEAIAEAWFSDRFRLCQTQIPEGDPYYFGEIQPTDKSYLRTSFIPEQYTQEDLLAKQVYQAFWKDPLVKAALKERG